MTDSVHKQFAPATIGILHLSELTWIQFKRIHTYKYQLKRPFVHNIPPKCSTIAHEDPKKRCLHSIVRHWTVCAVWTKVYRVNWPIRTHDIFFLAKNTVNGMKMNVTRNENEKAFYVDPNICESI